MANTTDKGPRRLTNTALNRSRRWHYTSADTDARPVREQHPVIAQYTRRLARIAANNAQWKEWEDELAAELPVVNQVRCGGVYCDSCALRDHPDDCDGYRLFLDSEGERLAPQDYKCNGIH